MKKGVLGIIAICVAVATAIGMIVVAFSGQNADERKISSFVKCVSKNKSEKVNDMIFADSFELFGESVSIEKTENNIALLKEVGLSTPDAILKNDGEGEIKSMKVVGTSVNKDSDISEFSLLGITYVKCYNVVIEYKIKIDDDTTKEYVTETIYVIKSNGKKYIML